MKTTHPLKLLGFLVLVALLAAGCAGPEEEAPAAGSSAEQAIAAAKEAYARAKREGYAWRDTGKIIKKAEKALAAGDEAKATKLANKARKQSEMAIEQKYRELRRLEALGIIKKGSAPRKPVSVGTDQYEVVRGDNLWDIAGKQDIYANPFQWPLIYKANQDKIKDADLIYPGQVFDINRNASPDEVNAAIQHAKTRGAWSLGVVEESDRAYLAQ